MGEIFEEFHSATDFQFCSKGKLQLESLLLWIFLANPLTNWLSGIFKDFLVKILLKINFLLNLLTFESKIITPGFYLSRNPFTQKNSSLGFITIKRVKFFRNPLDGDKNLKIVYSQPKKILSSTI